MKHIITMNETSVHLAKEYQKKGLAKKNSIAQATFIYDMVFQKLFTKTNWSY